MLHSIHCIPVQATALCKTYSVSPRALAITAVALMVIGAAMAYRIPPFSNFGVRSGLALFALGAVIGAFVVYAECCVPKVYLRRKGSSLIVDPTPQNRQLAQDINALLQRFQINDAERIEISRDSIRVDGNEQVLNPTKRCFLEIYFRAQELPIQGIRVHIQKTGEVFQRPKADKPTLLSLPDELLMIVITFLPQRERLNLSQCHTLFYRLSSDMSCWKKSRFPRRIPPEQLNRLLCAHGQHIQDFSCGVELEEIYRFLPSFPATFFSRVLHLSCPNLAQLNIHGRIDRVRARVLVSNFQCVSSLQRLDLSNNILCQTGAIAIANNLSHITNLQELALRGNKIGGFGTATLASKFHLVSNLQRLDLGNNDIGSDGAIAISNNLSFISHLQELNLEGGGIGGSGAYHLGDKLNFVPNLRKLNLSGNDIGGHGAVAFANKLSNIPCLQELNLSQNRIGITEYKAIANIFHLVSDMKKLNLSSNRIEDFGAECLANDLSNLPVLQRLYIGNNKISSKRIEYVRSKTNAAVYF